MVMLLGELVNCYILRETNQSSIALVNCFLLLCKGITIVCNEITMFCKESILCKEIKLIFQKKANFLYEEIKLVLQRN